MAEPVPVWACTAYATRAANRAESCIRRAPRGIADRRTSDGGSGAHDHLKRVMAAALGLGAWIGMSYPGVALAGNAAHQSAVSSADPAPTSSGRGLQAVIVTAQRIRENAQKVPIGMTVVSGATLKHLNIYDTSQLPVVAPSLQLEGSNDSVGAIEYFIRGVGSGVRTLVGESSVATVIDGVAMSRPEMGVVQFFDIQQIEVLNGPQGFLFGKNASAGLVNITTTPPALGRYETLAHLEYGNSTAPNGGDEYVGEVAQNLPIGANQALRLEGFYTSNSGEIRNLIPNPNSHLGQQEDGAKLKYLWDPSDRLEIYGIGDIAVETGMGPEAQAFRIDRPAVLQPIDLAAGVHASPTNVDMASQNPYNSYFTSGGGQVQVSYRMHGGYHLTNLMAERVFRGTNIEDSDFTPASIFDVNDQRRNEKQFSEELRLASPSTGVFTYQAGLYYLYGRYQLDRSLLARFEGVIPVVPPPGMGLVGVLDTEVIRSRSYAAYGQGAIHITHRLRLTAGGRLTRDDILGTLDRKHANALIQIFGQTPIHENARATNFSWRGGLEYDVTPDSLAYFTYARGYKGPAIDDSRGATEPLRPEIPTSIELGSKSTLLDNHLILNVDVYHTNFVNYQAVAFDPTLSENVLKNAGELRTQGFELNLTARPLSGLTLTTALEYTDAYYVSFRGQSCYPLEPAGTGINQCDPVNQTSDASGNRLENAPRWSGSISADYEYALNNGMLGFVRANYHYRSWVNFDANGDPNTVAPGFGIAGASVGVSSESGLWTVSVFARNLTDTRFPTYINLSPALALSPADNAQGGDYLNEFGVDSFRTVGVSVDLRF